MPSEHNSVIVSKKCTTPAPGNDSIAIDYLSKAKSLYDTYLAQVEGPPIGYTPQEIAALTARVGHPLPLAYTQYLAWGGKLPKLAHSHAMPNPACYTTATLFRGPQTKRWPAQLLAMSVSAGFNPNQPTVLWFFLPTTDDNPPVYLSVTASVTMYLGRLTTYLENRIRRLASPQYYLGNVGIALLGEIIGVTPRSLHYQSIYHPPHQPIPLTELIVQQGGLLGDHDIWQKQQIIVIGEHNFDGDYLRHSITIGQRYGFTCNYIAETDFAHYFQFGALPDYSQAPKRIKEHAGLAYLSAIGFTWPTIDPVAATFQANTEFDLADEHPLFSIYRYNVQKQTPLHTRRLALRTAIREEELGLRNVAYHLAFLIRTNRRRPSRQRAIDLWLTDLNWLRTAFYDGTIHTFIWPTHDDILL
jgi:hypothetical protein